MPAPTLEEFCERLISSGLLSAAELENDLPQAESEPKSDSAESLARFLVNSGKLTAWQAKQVYRGQTKSLVLGNYVLLDKLGQGGMGMVFKAEHQVMKRIVALKTLSPEIVKSPNLVARFRREVQVAARLDHPNIVTAFDAAQDGATHYLVMQYVAGEDLSARVRRKGVLPLSAALDVLAQAAAGLGYAHEQGVIHRDIKPSNLLVDENGAVRVLDMGLARLEAIEATSSELTGTGTVMGTIDYMSPEQAENTRQADARSDIYSLGCTFFYLLVGRAPFQGETVVQRILAHRDAEIPSLKDLSKEVGTHVDQLFRKMVAKQPAERFQSMSEVQAALKQIETQSSAVKGIVTSSDASLQDFIISINSGTAADEFLHPDSFAYPRSENEPSQNPTVKETALNGSANSNLRNISDWSSHSKYWIGGVVAALLILLVFISTRDKDQRNVNESLAAGSEHEIQDSNRMQNESVSSNDESVTARPANSSGLRFDGIDDYAVIPELSLNDSAPITIETWITPESDEITANPVMLMGTHWMTLYQTGRDWGVGKLNSDVSPLLKRSGSVIPGQLVHVAGVWDGEQSHLFINGERQPPERYSFPLRPTESGLYLGGAPAAAMGENAPDRFYRGIIHQVRISSGVVYEESFSPETEFTLQTTTQSLIRLNEGSGEQIRDFSKQRRVGQLNGATWWTR